MIERYTRGWGIPRVREGVAISDSDWYAGVALKIRVGTG